MTRFTPAYAGNTAVRSLPRPRARVHPRIRGEYKGVRGVPLTLPGSPPHTRGILKPPFADLESAGFTPAYAGNTRNAHDCQNHQEVHPRIRGEYTGGRAVLSMRQGSPPHTRGIRHWALSWTATPGFTPAYAGNTLIGSF